LLAHTATRLKLFFVEKPQLSLDSNLENLINNSVQNIKNIFLILSCNSTFCPKNSLNSSGHGLYKVLKAFYRDAGPF
jgi:hypothetical protein